MGSLLPWLGELLSEGYSLQQDGVKEGVESLERELESIHAALRKVTELPANQLDEQDKLWASEMRELSYDIDDVLDTFLVRAATTQGGLRQKTGNWFKKHFTTRHHIDDRIKEMKELAKEVATRRGRYRVDVGVVAKPAAATLILDPVLLALHTSDKALVGITHRRDGIIKMLDEGHEIVSIVGVGGLGKTTLANQVYKSLQGTFECRAFVSVGQHPETTQIYEKILRELDCDKFKKRNMATWDGNQYIEELRLSMRGKRCFIVIDDIWSVTVWDDIRIALADSNSNCGSKIITTTRNLDLARKIGGVYELQQLSDDNSMELFYKRIQGGGGDKYPDDQLVEVSRKFLEKCSGIPLAIITIASLLATKPRGDWPKVYDSIGFGQEDSSDVDNMRSILSFSYYDLPCHLKACLLYLGISKGGSVFETDSLIWMWIAEGFVHKEHGKWLFELGERYLYQLMSRCLVQPVEVLPFQGMVTGCRVHDVVLDLIRYLTSEENFLVLFGNEQDYTSPQGKKIRRLCIQGRNVGVIPEAPQVRSFSLTGCAIEMVLPFSSFQVLRVLHLAECRFMEEGYHLKHLGDLLHLRYLGLLRTSIRALPLEIGDLKFLQTLDLRGIIGSEEEELPPSVGQLRMLKCLHADSVGASDWMGNLTSLEELWLGGDVSRSPSFVQDLGKLTELRVLRICIGAFGESLHRALVESVGKLRKIQVLRLADGRPSEAELLWCLRRKKEYDVDACWEGFVPPGQLHHLELEIEFYRLPVWINSSHLPNLSHLWVTVETLEAQDVDIIGSFTELLTLHLLMAQHGDYPAIYRFASARYGTIPAICGGAFPKLRYWKASVPISFLPGAAPRLESVGFPVDVRGGGAEAPVDFASLGNLPCLKEVNVDFYVLPMFPDSAPKAALRHAVDIHPNSPILHQREIPPRKFTGYDLYLMQKAGLR